MIDRIMFYGVSLMDLRERMARKSGVPSSYTVRAAREYRSRLESFSGTVESQLSMICSWLGLSEDTANEDDLINGLIDYWWEDLVPLVGKVERKPRTKAAKLQSVPRKKKTEFYAKYCVNDKEQFDRIVKKYNLTGLDAEYPYLTIRGTKFHLSAVAHDIPYFPVASDHFEV